MNSSVAEAPGAARLTARQAGIARLPIFLLERVGWYIQLTKPRIILLFALTGMSALVVEGSVPATSTRFWMISLGILLTGACANALNQFFDRDIDAVMERTRSKRPLPQGQISPASALIFSMILGALSVAILNAYSNLHTIFWGLFTIAYYVGFYTLWLKRRTPYNIVIGGAAGATAPLMGWAAATGHLSVASVIMFLIVFVWTPPHFWALALCLKDEYAGVSVPMLPVVKGELRTRQEIYWYTVVLVPLTLTLYFTGDCGKIYLGVASLTGLEFLRRAYNLKQRYTRPESWQLFGYSIAYLLLLFIVMIVDARWR